MGNVITSFLVCLAAIDLPAGTELQYTGTVNQLTKNGVAEVKSFTFYAVAVTAEDGSSQIAFHLEERGGGSWGWTERFGILPTGNNPNSKMRSLRVLQTHEDQQYPLTIRSPAFEFRDKLVPQASWTDGRREYVVTRQRKVNEHPCVQIDVSSNLGRIQTLVVEVDTGLLVSLDEKIIIGRGDEFQLKIELKSQTQLGTADLTRFQNTLELLLGVQSSLNRTGDQKSIELTAEQQSSLRKELPRIEKEAEGTSWSRFVAAIGRDLQQQQKRIDGVARMEKKLNGQPAPNWNLKLANGNSISDADFKDKVLVMHFWQYRGEPLNEPYGQIGYLDFLNGKRKKLGVAVIGVNVDERFANPQQAAVAKRSMKALLDFMKISYDVALDDGTTLAEFGDPRSTGAPLPLWIVIGHDGVVTHYHTGFYNIKPDEGLKPLDDAVIEALRRQKGN